MEEWEKEGGTVDECLNRLAMRCGEEGAGPTTIEAVKNGSGQPSRPMEMCHEGSSINILIKASRTLEGPRVQTASHQPRGVPKAVFAARQLENI